VASALVNIAQHSLEHFFQSVYTDISSIGLAIELQKSNVDCCTPLPVTMSSCGENVQNNEVIFSCMTE